VQRPFDPGTNHLALRVDDVDAVYARLLAAGVTAPGSPTTITAAGPWNGARCVYVEDPDGRTVELVQRPA
jgi:catechol 2,3-dioxygenase-like lactoylglutathione lyase family enzyme